MKHPLCSLLLLVSSLVAAGELQVADGQVRAPLPGVDVTAGFLALSNHGQDDELLSVSSPLFAKIEIHTHQMQDDMMKMVQLPSLAIPAHQTLVFQTGGLHLMMFAPTQSLKVGDSVPVSLKFRSGAQLSTEFKVVDVAATSNHAHHQH